MAPVQRMNYFDQQFLRAADFITEQDYHRQMRRLHARALGLSGIVAGYGLASAGLQLTVAPGFAVDREGRAIVLSDPRRLDLAAAPLGQTLWVVLSYAERPTEPSDETGVLGDTRVNEEPVIETRDAAPADPALSLVLGRVTRQPAAIAIEGRAEATLVTLAGPPLALSSRLAVGPVRPTWRAVELVGDLGWGSTELQCVLSDEFGINLGRDRRITFGSRAGGEPDESGPGLYHDGAVLRIEAETLGLPGRVTLGDDASVTVSFSGPGRTSEAIERGPGVMEVRADDFVRLSALEVHLAARARLTFTEGGPGIQHDDGDDLTVLAGTVRLPGDVRMDGAPGSGISFKGEGTPQRSDEAVFTPVNGVLEVRAADELTLRANEIQVRGDLDTEGTIRSEGGEIHSAGAGAGYSFDDRTTGARWVWYASDGAARLWSGTDRFMFDQDGTVSANVKNFRIQHPTEQECDLVHASLEGPEIAVVYRGQGALAQGRATVELPDYFEALTRPENRTVLLTPLVGADGRVARLGASEVRDGRFSVYAGDADDAYARFFWEVKAVRADVPALEVEPLRERVDIDRERSVGSEKLASDT